VIQKHDATRLHYDFRIEVDGVLKSWAIPKGPSTNPHDKRLAVMVEDHEIEYAKFEGIIGEGEYGAGVVMVWDKGTYANLKQELGYDITVPQMIEKGIVEIRLEGKKLKGGWVLVKTRWGKANNWLLIKMNDEKADPDHDITVDQPNSAKTGRTMKEIKTAG
jgi:DNA ligase D-like protein (predicted 3'-phosphoesterase)